ncbi:MAG: GNAT family N-acetyltransferase [Acidobacteria bacterium]|nr:GNAT family N-acetyltransferase [Acidobacteriota bacterium]
MVAIIRLTPADRELARATFLTMAEVFETSGQPLSDAYLDRLLGRDDFWAFAAVADGRVAGGLRAHVLPMTASETAELFLYDIAVRPDCQRQGIGRQLVAALRARGAAHGIDVMFVPADNEDTHALDFYRALGGVPAPVTFFTFGADGD